MYTVEIKFHPQTISLQKVNIDGENKFGIHPATFTTLLNTYSVAIQTAAGIDVDIEKDLQDQLQEQGYLILTEIEKEIEDQGYSFELFFVYKLQTDPQNYFRLIETDNISSQHPAIATVDFIN